MKAIVNGKIILEDQIQENSALLFSDVILGVVGEYEVPKDAEIIDARGGYVAPGFIDLHIHGRAGRDVCEGSYDALSIIASSLLSCGVTAFLPTTMTVDLKLVKKVLELCRSLKQDSILWGGSVILGCHAEGPFISSDRKGAQDERYILKPNSSFVKDYADVIKIITIAPECDDDFSFTKDVTQNTDVVVSMGHTNASFNTAILGCEAGVNHATHLFNAMSGIDHKSPGVAAAALTSDVSCELIADNIHVSPALYDMVWKLKGRKLCLVTDCLSAGGLNEGEYILGGNKIIYDGTICRLEDSTIAGSALGLNRAVWNFYKNSSAPLFECVNCASLNPASVLGIQDKKGSLKANKDADIIITDFEFNVCAAIIGGKIKYKK